MASNARKYPLKLPRIYKSPMSPMSPMLSFVDLQ